MFDMLLSILSLFDTEFMVNDGVVIENTLRWNNVFLKRSSSELQQTIIS